MFIDGEWIIRLAAVLGALGTLGAFFYRSFCWVERQSQQEAEIENIKKNNASYVTGCWQHWMGWNS